MRNLEVVSDFVEVSVHVKWPTTRKLP